MEDIELKTLKLVNFDKKNSSHISFFKKLNGDSSIKKRFQGLLSPLVSKEKFGKAFLVGDNNDLVGYIEIGEVDPDDDSVYLRAAVDEDKRGHGYGKRILSETSEYLFDNTDIRSIKLKIADDNIPSMKVAFSGGYEKMGNEIYKLDNPYYKKNIRK